MSRSKRVHPIYVLNQNKKIIFEPFNSGDDLTDQSFVATIQMCIELVFLSLQNHFVSVSFICEATRFTVIEFKFNIKEDGSWVLGRSPDMTIRKVREKHNHSKHYSCQYSMYL